MGGAVARDLGGSAPGGAKSPDLRAPPLAGAREGRAESQFRNRSVGASALAPHLTCRPMRIELGAPSSSHEFHPSNADLAHHSEHA
jgi:hypothetical protein